MTSTWNKCFLCLSDLSSVSLIGRKRKRRISSVNLEIILQYLLQANKDDNQIFKSILQLQSCETDGGEPLVKLCERCESTKQRISDLHQELEVVQMKLIDSVGSVRKAIIQASEKVERLEENGTNINTDNELFEGSSGRSNAKANSSKYQSVLRAFQNMVQERNKDCANVPFVYLERCLRYNKVLQAQNQNSGKESIQSIVTNDFIIKTEPEPFPIESIGEDDGDLDLPEADVKTGPFCDEPAYTTDVEKTHLARHPCQSKVKRSRRKRKPRKSLFTVAKKRKLRVAVPIIKTEAASNFKFDCKICLYQLRKYQSFRIEHHLRQHETSEKIYKCPQCPTHEGFSGEQLFQLHLTYHKRSTGMYCRDCNKRILKFELGDHYRAHGYKVFQCDGCAFSTTSQEKFLNHSEIFRAKTEQFKCHICAEVFGVRKRLFSHLHQVHNAIEMKVCDFENCGMKFFSDAKLTIHKRKHNASIICHECGKKFAYQFELEVHQVVHTGELPFPCDQCSQAFRLKQYLDKHKMREHSAPKFKCPQCDNEYTTSTRLRRHIESIHEGMRYPCEYCDKICDSFTILKRHQHRHTSQERLVCEVCQKKFTMVEGLKKHMLIHTGEKNFVCNYCSKSFTFESYLQNHLRIHTGDKPFLCAYCGKAFNQVAGLYLHKKSQHLKEFEQEKLDKK